MAISTWVYRTSDNVFLRGGFYDPEHDPAVEGIVKFLDADPHPDVVLDRFDAVTGKRRATAAEVLAAKPPNPYGFRRALPSIFAGTAAEKMERMFALRQRVPGLTEPFLQAIHGPGLDDQAAAWVRRIATEVKTRIGLAGEVLTQVEYDAIKVLAGQHGMGALFL